MRKSEYKILQYRDLLLLVSYFENAIFFFDEILMQYIKQVLSLPEYNFALGYASVIDYNTQKMPRRQFSCGQR